MVNYECPRCGYETTQRQKYNRHIDNKTQCSDKYATVMAACTDALASLTKLKEDMARFQTMIDALSPVTNTVVWSPATVPAPISSTTLRTSDAPAAGLTFIDLFCGVGGFHQALTQLGGRCVLACDIDAKCREVYEANYGLKPHEDVTKLETATMPDFDVLCGGFPCFVAGTQVLTESGYKTIESVTLEDRLLTHTGSFQRILNLQRKTGTPTLRILRVAGRTDSIQCTEEHPFYTRRRNDVADWLPARDLTTYHYVGMPVKAKNDKSAGGALEVQRQQLKRGLLYAVDGTSLDASVAFIDGGYAWFKIESNETIVGTLQTVYNFEVEKDNSYCVENTIVHNCQAFSHSGKQGGFEDTRGTLFRDCARILKDKQPKFFLMENVKNLKGHDEGRTWATIYRSFTEAGYTTYEHPVVLSPHQLGVPQHRERVLLMGIRNDLAPPVLPEMDALSPPPCNIRSILMDDADIPEGTALTADDTGILDRWEEVVQYFKAAAIKLPTFPMWSEEWDGAYPLTEAEKKPEWKAKFLTQNREFYREHIAFLGPWLLRARATPKFVGAKSKFEWQAGAFQAEDSLWRLLFQFRPSGIRVKRATYSPALVALAQIVYVGEKRRKLCPREVARLQSFPDSFQLPTAAAVAYKQFGNSVNVEVIKYAMRHILTKMAPKSEA